jgi:hypothetical protein
MTKMITTNSPMIPMRNPPFHSLCSLGEGTR